MKRVTGVFEGEKIDLQEIKKNDGKLNVNLYILSGFESIKIAVRDNEIWKEVKAIPNRKPVKIKAEVTEYKGELYLNALGILA